MAITARVLTKIELPEYVKVEIEDTVRGQTVVRSINFHQCLEELGELGTVDLHQIDPAELISIGCAICKHRAIDQYLLSLGIDPHAELHMVEEVKEDPLADG